MTFHYIKTCPHCGLEHPDYRDYCVDDDYKLKIKKVKIPRKFLIEKE